jgi:hypothetical protein
MTLLPNGQTASYREDSEASAKKELRRITEAYLARIREIYPDLDPAIKPKVAAAMRELKAAVMPHWMQGKVRRIQQP